MLDASSVSKRKEIGWSPVLAQRELSSQRLVYPAKATAVAVNTNFGQGGMRVPPIVIELEGIIFGPR